MKIKVQAQHLLSGDIVGSGEVVYSLIINSVRWPSNKICVRFHSKNEPNLIGRECMWGKYTMIGVERKE